MWRLMGFAFQRPLIQFVPSYLNVPSLVSVADNGENMSKIASNHAAKWLSTNVKVPSFITYT